MGAGAGRRWRIGMTVSRVKCPASDLWGDRHMVTDRRWALVAPDGEEII